MKLMSLKQYKKMSKTALMRKITKTLRAMPKAKLALLCYNLTKAKLPRLKTTKQKAYQLIQKKHVDKRKAKRKKMTEAEKKKFLSRLNKGRKKAGLKPIRAKR